jgi:protein-S-isoprenylcysteine O-methyltransferase Ste14
MSPWFGKALVLVGIVAALIIRAPHGLRSGKVKVAESRRGRGDATLLALMWFTMMALPLVYIATPALDVADYPLLPLAFSFGTICLFIGLWFLYRAHADLGTNWSMSLELREGHRLVTHGVYEHIRHPMYAALLLQAVAQALLLPNWVAGPWCLVVLLVLVTFRLGPEEQMMREKFGKDYVAYMARTKRLITGIW